MNKIIDLDDVKYEPRDIAVIEDGETPIKDSQVGYIQRGLEKNSQIRNQYITSCTFSGLLQTIPNNTSTAILGASFTDKLRLGQGWGISDNGPKVPSKGIYNIQASITWDGDDTGRRLLILHKNGSAIPNRFIRRVMTSSDTTLYYMNINTTMELLAGDIISMVVLQESGGDLNVADGEITVIKLS